jgi:hypothetical protein
MTDRVQTVNQLLGDEIVFCASLPGIDEPVPIVMAGVRPGKRAELSSALEGLFAAAGEAPAAYSVSDELLVVSSSPSHLAWALAHLGRAPAPRSRQPPGTVPARRGLADRHGCAPGGQDGVRRRRAAESSSPA